MADTNFNEWADFGFGPRITKANYYLHFFGNLDLVTCDELFGFKEDGAKWDGLEWDRVTCIRYYNSTFIKFQEWCRVIYDEMKDNQDKAYFFFRDLLIEFQLDKKNSFDEKKDKIYHVRMTLPISKEGNAYQQMAFIIHEYLNLAINCLEDYVIKLKSPSHTGEKSIQETYSPSLKTKSKLHGFKIKNKDCLRSAFERLKYLKLIHNDVSFKDFENAFSDWIPDNKIIWLEGPGLLSYFIKSINNKGIRDEKKNIWITTINCFQDENLNNYEVKQLRFAKKPTKTEDVDLVIKAINRYSEEE